ncbi:acyl-ACP desaturase [Streptococcus sp. sy004]|uniref:acyl-ACP desaturase n=1 Tax=Streptococcus sp. sy004 TaxID=2600149 RepID=UPI0021BD8609|nr:acyl-ACP desaturase [Streptococcus sp. sy004]
MGTLVRNQQFNFRVNGDILTAAKKVAQKKGVSLADALNQFLEVMVETQDFPVVKEDSRYVTKDELLVDMEDIFSEYDQVFRELVTK